MKQIREISLPRARNGEHFQFHFDVLAVVTPAIAEEQKITALRDRYAAAFEREDKAYVQNRTFEGTGDIEAKDRVRDDLFIFVKQTVDANLYNPVEATKAAAQKMAYVLKPYARANSSAYAENTALLINFIGDMEVEANAAAAATLGLTDALALLKAANEEFNAVYTSRTGEKLTREETGAMKGVRGEVDDAYRTLIDGINALYMANALVAKDAAVEKTLGGVIDALNGLIIQLQQSIDSHSGRSTKDQPVDAGSSDQ